MLGVYYPQTFLLDLTADYSSVPEIAEPYHYGYSRMLFYTLSASSQTFLLTILHQLLTALTF